MSKNIKNLSMSMIKKNHAQKYKKKKQVLFNNGTKVDIDVAFDPLKRVRLIEDFHKIIVDALKNEKNLDGETFTAFSTMLIIKHFTSIETDVDNYDGLIEMIILLGKDEYSDVVNKIMTSFDEEQLFIMFEELESFFLKVNEEILKITENNDVAPILPESILEKVE